MIQSPSSLASRLEPMLMPQVKNLGYELLDVEFQPRSPQGGAILRLFIEHPDGKPIMFEDCAAVDHGLDPILETPEFEAILPEAFSLEVSSPGLDRPLKKPEDFVRFAGKKAEIKTSRPITLEEMGNAKYFEHHQKQKNFFGILHGFAGGSVELETDNERFMIPLAAIIKANLDVTSQLSVDDAKE
jgi:ribosome maturation factor RimP